LKIKKRANSKHLCKTMHTLSNAHQHRENGPASNLKAATHPDRSQGSVHKRQNVATTCCLIHTESHEKSHRKRAKKIQYHTNFVGQTPLGIGTPRA
jgi:hypothetical protein